MHVYDKNFNYITETEDISIYNNGEYIITNKLFANPIMDSNGEIREATREELVAKGVEVVLEAGEIIQDKKLVKIPQPSKYHAWNGTEWVVNLEEVKKQKLRNLKKLEIKI